MLNEKKHSEAMQTLRAGCSKVEPKVFAPPQTRRPPSQGRGTAKI